MFDKTIEALRSELALIKEQMSSKEYSAFPEELQTQLNEKQTKLQAEVDRLNDQESARSALQDRWKALTTLEGRRQKRVRSVEGRFFDLARIKHSSESGEFIKTAAQQFLESRFAPSNDEVTSLDATDQPARRMIIAEKALLGAVTPCSQGRRIGWRSNDKNKESWVIQGSGYSGDNCFSNHEIVVMDEGNIEIRYKQRTDPKPQRPGDAKVLDIGTYAQICGFIQSICENNKEKEMQLAELMRRFSHDGKIISDEDVSELLIEETEEKKSKTYSEEEIREKALYLNRICFLAFIKEPSEWFESSDEKRRFGWLTAQARSIRLLCEGYLSMEDVFDKNSPYGIFTGLNLIDSPDDVYKKMQNIHSLYEKWLEHQEKDTSFDFFKKHPESTSKILATRREHRKELQYLYGGESDTDGEGYDTDGNEDVFKVPSLLF